MIKYHIAMCLVAITTLPLMSENYISGLSEERKYNATETNASTDEIQTDTYESFSDLGLAASKVYTSDTALSIGGYGEFKAKKYTIFKNYTDDTSNKTRKKLETNVVRFVPYFGYKFNDWIVMNTEVEFEDGGARSDNTDNYKYAIVEFSYIDFLIDEAYSLRVGHVLVPFGNINLNHEPVSFLTAERPLVETFIIPSTWHTNGALVFGTIDALDYYAGIVTSLDAGKFVEGRFIQQGRLGARQFTDDFSAVLRVNYAGYSGVEFGGSLFNGTSSVLAQDKPGDTVTTLDASFNVFLIEAHASYKANGFDIQTLYATGSFGDGYTLLNTPSNTISGEVSGGYLTVGYDLLQDFKTSQKFFGIVELEHLNLDANSETAVQDNYKFNEYTAGIAYYPEPKVAIKAEYNIKDYHSHAKLADEEALTASLGFIF